MVPLINQIEQYLRKSFFFCIFTVHQSFTKGKLFCLIWVVNTCSTPSHTAHSSQLHGCCRSIRFHRFLFCLFSLLVDAERYFEFPFNCFVFTSTLARHFFCPFTLPSYIFALCLYCDHVMSTKMDNLYCVKQIDVIVVFVSVFAQSAAKGKWWQQGFGQFLCTNHASENSWRVTLRCVLATNESCPNIVWERAVYWRTNNRSKWNRIRSSGKGGRTSSI